MRPIDADALFDFLTDQLETEAGFYSKGRNAGLNIARSALHDKTITPTISPPSNDPLTLEELREMDRAPVWLSGDGLNRYDIFRGERSPGWADFYCGRFSLFCYGKDWLAYRRKPEEGTWQQ